jgi:hypothetical protein
MLVKAAAALATTGAALLGENGDAAGSAPIAAIQLATPGAPELLSAFAAIEDKRRRKAFLALARAIADDRR